MNASLLFLGREIAVHKPHRRTLIPRNINERSIVVPRGGIGFHIQPIEIYEKIALCANIQTDEPPNLVGALEGSTRCYEVGHLQIAVIDASSLNWGRFPL